jgi:hypothetical protein
MCHCFFGLDQVAKVSLPKVTDEKLSGTVQGRATQSRASKSISVTRLWQGNEVVDKKLQTCILSYIGGSIIRKWRRKNQCVDCLAIVSNSMVTNAFFKHKEYKFKTHGLQRPSNVLVNAMSTMETIFLNQYLSFFSQTSILKRFMHASRSVYFPAPPCHPHLREFFFVSFFKIRIFHQCKLLTLSVRDNKYKTAKKAKHLGIIARKLKRRSMKILIKTK